MTDVSSVSKSKPSIGGSDRVSTVYRMVMWEHVCPYGLKTVSLLERQGYRVDDHWLKTREETDSFKEERQVKSTPQTFIGGERIGGYDDVRKFFGKPVPKEGETNYRPVLAIFAVSFLMALAVG